MGTPTACVLLLILAVPCPAAYYAVDKGSIQLGGSLGFETSSGDLYEANGDGESVLGFEPFFGYFIMPHVALGWRFQFTTWSQGDDDDWSVLAIGPVLAYYFGREYAKMYPFISAHVEWRQRSATAAGQELPDETSTSMGLAVGLTSMVSKNVGIRSALFYNVDNIQVDDTDYDESGAKIGLRVGIESFIW
jgi:hypothetical protein